MSKIKIPTDKQIIKKFRKDVKDRLGKIDKNSYLDEVVLIMEKNLLQTWNLMRQIYGIVK